ncbi:MAG: sigma E positive regulator RseC/MucC [Peptoclostridium sp.]|uniref:SoxR reducing system RseC family protein n=1 Tax=Peptoclostridium sp. TaxID=1904860 RepID=UPI00139E9AFF|nr:SoxR reducing system RseC family protein [Peptoclostridium sp.]MZQ76130.1 sigma E positive regulator RseC/MucC [Peptoclostridium sp.]
MASESSKVKIEAINTADANVGELVSIDMKNPDVLKAAFIAYGLPLLVLIAGVLSVGAGLNAIGYRGDSEIVAGVVSLLLTGAAYLIIRKNEEKIGQIIGYSPAITEVLKHGEI